MTDFDFIPLPTSKPCGAASTSSTPETKDVSTEPDYPSYGSLYNDLSSRIRSDIADHAKSHVPWSVFMLAFFAIFIYFSAAMHIQQQRITEQHDKVVERAVQRADVETSHRLQLLGLIEDKCQEGIIKCYWGRSLKCEKTPFGTRWATTKLVDFQCL